MIVRGRVKNGVVVFEHGAFLAEDTPVVVWPDAVKSAAGMRNDSSADSVSQEDHFRLLNAIDRIAALPIEGSQEPFGGVDHDRLH